MTKQTEQKPEPTPEELAKAKRTIMILYAVMAVMIVLPFIAAWILSG